MKQKNFSTKRQIDSYLKGLDNLQNAANYDSYFEPYALENDYVPDLGNTSKQEKKKIKTFNKQYLYFRKLKEDAKKCQLCGFKPSSPLSLVIDHEHFSRKIRGVLCQNCNHGLGKFRDNPELMKKAADWVGNFDRTEALDYYTLKKDSECQI